MAKQIIISAEEEETRMALVEDGVLTEYLVEREHEETLVGSIFLARVRRVVAGICAAFLDIGTGTDAFLPLRQSERLTEGESVLVQIVKDARGDKGPQATSEVTIPGRYVVLAPGAGYIHMSRKIKCREERQRLARALANVQPQGAGIIIRTAAEGVPDEKLASDVDSLTAAWKQISARAGCARPPALVRRELSLVIRTARDYFTQDVERVLVDGRQAFERLQSLFVDAPEELRQRLQLYKGEEDIFCRAGLEEQLVAMTDRCVELPGGGSIVIDKTEAMTVIDVNSGRGSRETQAVTTLDTNLEAAAEIARQLRLRDIGGIVVVDFIDMDADAQQKVLTRLRKCLRADKMHPRVHDITQLNLVEITRKKARQNVDALLYAPCPMCRGSGRVKSPSELVLEVKRSLRHVLTKQGASRELLITAHPTLIERLRHELYALRRELSCSITLEEDAAMHAESFSILDNGK